MEAMHCKLCSAKLLVFLLSYLRTRLRLHSFSHRHNSTGVISSGSRSWTLNYIQALTAYPSTQCKPLHTMQTPFIFSYVCL